MTRTRSILALLFVFAAGAQAQSVRLEEVPTYPANPTTLTRVQARVQISGCGDLTVTPFILGNIIELRHSVDHCPVMPPVIEDSIDLGFLPAGDYTLRVVTLIDPQNPFIEDFKNFTVVPAGQSQCTAGPTVACMFNRFQVEVRFRAELNEGVVNRSANVLSVSQLQGTIYNSALFYLSDPSNAEVIVKLLDQGRDPLGRPVVAVLYGTATPLKLEISVRDNSTGITKVYPIGLGQLQGGADFTAFVK